MQIGMRYGAAFSALLTLAACGGGDEAQTFQPGEVLTFSMSTQDGGTQESHYLVHGVTAIVLFYGIV